MRTAFGAEGGGADAGGSEVEAAAAAARFWDFGDGLERVYFVVMRA